MEDRYDADYEGELLTEIDDLQSDLDNAKDEIDILYEEIDGFDSRLQDAFNDGYQRAIDNMKNKLEEIE